MRPLQATARRTRRTVTSEIGDDAIQAWVEAVREQQRRNENAHPDDMPPSRAELREALHHACAAAKKQPYVLGTVAYPSRWDNAHAHIDRLLDELYGR